MPQMKLSGDTKSTGYAKHDQAHERAMSTVAVRYRTNIAQRGAAREVRGTLRENPCTEAMQSAGFGFEAQPGAELLHGHRLRQISGFIDVGAPRECGVIRQ